MPKSAIISVWIKTSAHENLAVLEEAVQEADADLAPEETVTGADSSDEIETEPGETLT